MILDPDELTRDQTFHADVCVIGSGAGGAAAAMALAEAGLRVTVLEEGAANESRDFTQREVDMLPRLYREQSSRATADFSVLVVQGRTLGGATVPSFCSAFRPPAAILDDWEQRRGIAGVGSALMAPYFERVEKLLGVRRTHEDDVNTNNRLLRAGADRLGFHGRLVDHSRVDCVRCGFCALGCAYDRKNDGLTVLVPAASRAGAVFLPQCRAEAIELDKGRVIGVRGRVVDGGQSVPVRVQAPVAVLAAGAIASPQLWLASRLPDPQREVGRHLHLHPQVAVQAVFDEEVRGWEGVPQSYAVDRFLRTEVGGGGFLLTPLFAHPVAASSLTPGYGDEHRALMQAYSRIAMVSVALHDRTEGRVDLDDEGGASVTYHLVDDDGSDLIEGMQRAAEIFFAAGAKKVVLPFTELVALESADELGSIQRRVRMNDPLLLSYQPHGTLRMGSDPRTSVVDARGRAHHVPGLYVADASLFPTALAVPPQLAVMAFALRVAEGIGT